VWFCSSFVPMIQKLCWKLPSMQSLIVTQLTSTLDVHKPLHGEVTMGHFSRMTGMSSRRWVRHWKTKMFLV